MNPPRLVLEVGGTSTLQAAVPVKLKSPPLQGSKWGGTSALQAWLPAKLNSPPLQAEVWGGSRWADLAVCTYLHTTSTSTYSPPIISTYLYTQYLHIYTKYLQIYIQYLFIYRKYTQYLQGDTGSFSDMSGSYHAPAAGDMDAGSHSGSYEARQQPHYLGSYHRIRWIYLW